jgi:putative flippase GtrA
VSTLARDAARGVLGVAPGGPTGSPTLAAVECSPATSPDATVPAGGAATAYRSGLVRQLSRFVLVGGLSAMVDYGLYQLMLHLDLHASVAKAISFICGTTTAYLLNKRFTFDVTEGRGGAGRFTGFLLLYGTTFFVNVGVNALMLQLVPNAVPLQTSICWGIAQACATAINFLVLRTVIFKQP